ncbi:MAG TPA: hypothetical protein DDW52_11485 [Planctomycetaceae bacterium]|nr:hypothetical protein [Planctomycetaceae bacterium]
MARRYCRTELPEGLGTDSQEAVRETTEVMTQRQQSANPRQLIKLLDTQSGPMAVLDPAARLIFANAQLCKVANVNAKELIGKICSWTSASDHGDLQQVLSLLTPPANALAGHVAVRRLTSPPFFGSDISAELFIPLPGDPDIPGAIVVVLGHWDTIRDSFAHVYETLQPSGLAARDEETVLVELRSKWQLGETPPTLVGASDAVALASSRARIACESSCSLALIGPAGSGRKNLAKSIFLGRLKLANLARETGTFQIVDCNANHGDQFAAQLDLFQGRIRSETPAIAQTLCVLNFENIDPASEMLLRTWYSRVQQRACIMTVTSDVERLPAELRELEIELPALKSRRSDIAPLISFEFSRHIDMLGSRPRLDERAMELLEAYSWPGNVAELSRVVEAIAENIAMHAEETSDDPNNSNELLEVAIRDLPLEIQTYSGSRNARQHPTQPVELDQVLEEVEREVIARALRLSSHNRAAAARLLGISRPRLLRRIQHFGLDRRTGQDLSQE